MEFQSVGLGMAILFLFFTLLIVGVLFLLKTAIKILAQVFKNRTGKNIFWPLMFVTGFPMLMALFSTSVTMGLVVFSDPDVKLYCDIALGCMPLIVSFFLLGYILKHIRQYGFFQK